MNCELLVRVCVHAPTHVLVCISVCSMQKLLAVSVLASKRSVYLDDPNPETDLSSNGMQYPLGSWGWRAYALRHVNPVSSEVKKHKKITCELSQKSYNGMLSSRR